MRNIYPALIALAALSMPALPPAFAEDAGGVEPVTTFEAMPEPAHSGYETVNGLEMYFQVHGEDGPPLILLHGGLMTIETLGPLLPALAETRTVYAIELEGHGRTRDLETGPCRCASSPTMSPVSSRSRGLIRSMSSASRWVAPPRWASPHIIPRPSTGSP